MRKTTAIGSVALTIILLVPMLFFKSCGSDGENAKNTPTPLSEQVWQWKVKFNDQNRLSESGTSHLRGEPNKEVWQFDSIDKEDSTKVAVQFTIIQSTRPDVLGTGSWSRPFSSESGKVWDFEWIVPFQICQFTTNQGRTTLRRER